MSYRSRQSAILVVGRPTVGHPAEHGPGEESTWQLYGLSQRSLSSEAGVVVTAVRYSPGYTHHFYLVIPATIEGGWIHLQLVAMLSESIKHGSRHVVCPQLKHISSSTTCLPQVVFGFQLFPWPSQASEVTRQHQPHHCHFLCAQSFISGNGQPMSS